MQIDFLADYPQYVDTLAPPLLAHWRFALPEDTLAVRRGKLVAHLNRSELPIAWVAHEDGLAYGTAALRAHDLDVRMDLTPWLGGVFVLPAFRQRGIGSALCSIVARHAASLGAPTLFLFTLDQQALYERLGWRRIENTVWRGFGAVIMAKPLAAG